MFVNKARSGVVVSYMYNEQKSRFQKRGGKIFCRSMYTCKWDTFDQKKGLLIENRNKEEWNITRQIKNVYVFKHFSVFKRVLLFRKYSFFSKELIRNERKGRLAVVRTKRMDMEYSVLCS